MSNDWRQKAVEAYHKKSEDNAHKLREQQRQIRLNRIRQLQQLGIWEKIKQAIHKLRFKCEVKSCLNRSNGPYERHVWAGKNSNGYYVTDWNKPTGLWKCNMCGIYACSLHIQEVDDETYMCIECGKRL